VQAGQVTDTGGGSVPAGVIGTFSVNVAAASTPPTAALTVAAPTAGATTQTFTVRYTDNVAVKVSTLDNSDVLVTGPNGFSQLATFVSVDVASDGTPRTATYRINAPGGNWDATDNGTYSVALQAGQVTDTSGTPAAAATLGTFAANVLTPVVTTVSAPSVTTSGGKTYTFTVTYTDNLGINVSTLDSKDIRVTGPNGFSQLATFVSVSPTGNGTPRTVTYRLNAPGGSWDAGDNGTYTIAVQSGQVKDTGGGSVTAGTIGTFSVNISSGTLSAGTLQTSLNANLVDLAFANGSVT
jgi:large repetitive protein